MPGIAIKSAVVAELQRQLNQEHSAAYAYEALANWCVDQHFDGLAEFFRKQAAEERVHAGRFTTHLLDRGVLPELGQLAAPRCKFDGILDIAQQAQKMEQANSAGIHAAFEVAQREKDYPAQVLLHWFINEQVEEEAWTDELVDRIVRANCAGGLSDLDRHIEDFLGDEKD